MKLYEDYHCKYFGGHLPPIQIQVTHTDRREDTSWSEENDLASGIIRMVSPTRKRFTVASCVRHEHVGARIQSAARALPPARGISLVHRLEL